MAEPLKNMYNPAFFEGLCPFLGKHLPRFNCREFIHRIFDRHWPDLELKQRVKHIAVALHAYLPDHFPEAARKIVTISEAIRESGNREQSFPMMFLADYIQIYGLNHVDESLDAMEHVTTLVSCEFAIRPFLIAAPDKTFSRMLQWSRHEHASVRRLSSEGSRSRLPWGMGVPWLKENPEKIIKLLTNLKSDPSLYVRKSVANNLNDIAKDHPELVIQVAKKWKGSDVLTDWIVKHGCRTLLKKGDHRALALHGFNQKSESSVRNLRLSKKKVKVGEAFSFNFDFINKQKSTSSFRLEYAIDFRTAIGKTSTKVFQIKEAHFSPGIPASIVRNQSFKDLTTRKHQKGKHALHILVNGRKLASTEFILC